MRRPASLLPLVAGVVLLAAGCAADPEPRRPDSLGETERRIQFYSDKVEKNPRLYPVYAQLGTAYFDKARETHDPRWLAEARRALERSIAIAATHDAFVTMARVANYAHRFEDALHWARRALPATEPQDVSDPAVVAVLVEAHAALGEDAQARALLPPDGSAPTDLYTAAALAGFLSSHGRYDEASRAYDAAAALARAQALDKAALWASVAAAGALIDAGRPDLARPRLDAARRLDPGDPFLRLHEAECLEADRRPAEARSIYEALLEERPPDPEIHARACAIARASGDAAGAQRHFDAAERGFRRPLDAGEVYTLGALALLYSRAGTRLDEALALARRNLAYRRDREARETLADVERRIAARSRN